MLVFHEVVVMGSSRHRGQIHHPTCPVPVSAGFPVTLEDHPAVDGI